MREITIDFAQVHSREEFHSVLARELAFPAWYGNNLDALHDCLTDIREDTRIRLVHWESLEAELGKFAAGAKRAILHGASANPNVAVTFL